MSKDTYYFQHDYEPTSDPKIVALLGEYGATGYGIYWRIVEMLHSDTEHKLPHKKYIYLALAKQMLTSVEQIETIVNFAIHDCELLRSDGEHFWIDRVLRNIERRNDISKKRSKAGKASALAKQVSTSVEQNPTKDNKEKESKGNEIKDIYSPDFPRDIEAVEEHFRWYYDRRSDMLKNIRLSDLPRIASLYFDDRHSKGWKLNGTAIVKWKNDAQNYVKKVDDRGGLINQKSLRKQIEELPDL